MATKCVQIHIRGCVTGVYFRAATQREAKRLGLTGWVRNRNDGSVEILVEGEEDVVKELISWTHHGPSAARVEDVDVRYRAYSGDYSDFRIVE
jgi:acylphosphatase